MIPYSPTIRRRSIRTFAFRPAGVAAPSTAVAPGVYTLRLQYRPTTIYNASFRTDEATLRHLLDLAFEQLGVAARTTGVPRLALGGGVSATTEWSAPIAVTTATTEILLHRALARAAFHASSFAWKQESDGGASFVSDPRFQFALSPAPAQPGPAPQPTRPTPTPAPPPAPFPAFVGKPEAQLTRNEITRYQGMLIRTGHDVGRAGADGVIGSGTRTAVQAFQRTQNLSSPGQAGYGTLGPQTQAALERAQPGTAPAQPGPAPQPTRPAPTPTPAQPAPAPTQPAVPPRTATASMSGSTIAVAAVGAALVGAAIAFRDKLFPSPKSRGAGLRYRGRGR